MNKWDCIKLKNLYTAKKTVTILKRLLTEWKKIFANYSSDKELISRINRESKNLNSQRINNPIQKWAHELNRELSKKEIQIANLNIK
jgi:hypothetical protein